MRYCHREVCFEPAPPLCWVIVVTARVAALRWLAGVVLWVSTLIVGMVVRYFTGQGVAVIFVTVAASLLALTLVGWRAIAAAIRAMRRKEHP